MSTDDEGVVEFPTLEVQSKEALKVIMRRAFLAGEPPQIVQVMEAWLDDFCDRFYGLFDVVFHEGDEALKGLSEEERVLAATVVPRFFEPIMADMTERFGLFLWEVVGLKLQLVKAQEQLARPRPVDRR